MNIKDIEMSGISGNLNSLIENFLEVTQIVTVEELAARLRVCKGKVYFTYVYSGRITYRRVRGLGQTFVRWAQKLVVCDGACILEVDESVLQNNWYLPPGFIATPGYNEYAESGQYDLKI